MATLLFTITTVSALPVVGTTYTVYVILWVYISFYDVKGFNIIKMCIMERFIAAIKGDKIHLHKSFVCMKRINAGENVLEIISWKNAESG